MNKRIFILVAFLANIINAQAQKPKLAVLKIDNQIKSLASENITELARIQLTKFQKFEIVDRYEINSMLKSSEIDYENCFSLSCLVESGKRLNADLVVSGAIDKLGESLYVRFRIIDVKSAVITEDVVKEFIYLPEKITPMVTIALNELIGIPNDKTLEKSLSSTSSYESAVNNPHYNTLALNGPRMGYAFLTGSNAYTMKREKNEGGYNVYPALFQFGYQYEVQYLTEGKLQALVEFIPIISGLDQGLFIPSLTIMNGIRSNVNGLEFAIGPTFSIVKEAVFVKNGDGNYVFEESFIKTTQDIETIKRMDSRGNPTIKSSVVAAVGYSFKSGKLNIPVNVFFVPGNNGFRYGFSFGFNARKN